MFGTKDPLLRAASKIDVASVAFYDAIGQLKEAATELDAVAKAADDASTAAALRAGTARSQAAAARRRADRIGALLA